VVFSFACLRDQTDDHEARGGRTHIQPASLATPLSPTRPDDHLVAGGIAAPFIDRALQRGEDVALKGTGPCLLDRSVERHIRQLRRLAHVAQLRRGLHRSPAGDDVRRLNELAEVLHRGLDEFEVVPGESVGVGLDPESLTTAAMLGEDVPELQRRVLALTVEPDPDVADCRGELCLPEIADPSQQGHRLTIGLHEQALEEDVAEGVVAGQVVHRLLPEHEQAIEVACL